jgi:hypothetical protein
MSNTMGPSVVRRGTVEGLLKKVNIEHRTSNIECRM